MNRHRALSLVISSVIAVAVAVGACGDPHDATRRTSGDVAAPDDAPDNALDDAPDNVLAASDPDGCVVDPGSGALRYRVRAGDTLGRIAQRVYGDADLWREIARANPGVVLAHGGVQAGVELVIPFAGR